MSRPTIALCCILKNEKENLERFFDSIKDCFDEIHMTDTGSTDGTLETLKAISLAVDKVHLHEFKWVDDFSAARNFSFSHAKTDYIMWMDLDDVLSDKESFKKWRDTTMCIGDMWLATYNYAQDATGKSVCQFARERVVKRSVGFYWNYFVHEGLQAPPNTPASVVYATGWQIDHKRSAEDAKKDKSRNLNLFKSREKELDARMQYYYGKELFENQQELDAFPVLIKAIAEPGLEGHDRLMGIQYAAMAAMKLTQYDRAIQIAHQGLQLAPNRAEYFIIIADSYTKTNRFDEAIPFYNAASICRFDGGLTQGAIYSHEESYKHYPLNQLARIYFQKGEIEIANEFANKAAALGPNGDTIGILSELNTLKHKVGSIAIHTPKPKSEDIVFSCHPTGLYEWDEAIYKEKGIGGSETAVVEMSAELARQTGRKVLVFNNISSEKEYGNVRYIPAHALPQYFSLKEPKANINWRHNIRVTGAPTYVWSHDLTVPGIENASYYRKVLALSNFHKNFLTTLCGVKEENVFVTRNGINPERFRVERPQKQKAKVVWSSSPDRGLLRAVAVMDEVVKTFPEAEFHVFYGFDNMLKLGKQAEAVKIQSELSKRPYIKNRGNISKPELTREAMSSQVWLYPTDFLETFCITAWEMLACGAYPVVRKWGGLQDTLKTAHEDGVCSMLDRDCVLPEDVKAYADEVCKVFNGELKPAEYVDVEALSWRGVAEDWAKLMEL